ncbi:36563_t:CDS:1, partial [Racocetra persica]
NNAEQIEISSQKNISDDSMQLNMSGDKSVSETAPQEIVFYFLLVKDTKDKDKIIQKTDREYISIELAD